MWHHAFESGDRKAHQLKNGHVDLLIVKCPWQARVKTTSLVHIINTGEQVSAGRNLVRMQLDIIEEAFLMNTNFKRQLRGDSGHPPCFDWPMFELEI